MALPLLLLLAAGDDVTRHWLAFLALADLQALSSASRETARSPLRRVLAETAVWRLPYPPDWRRSMHAAELDTETPFDWETYERNTFLHGMDAATKRHIRAVSVPRSALLKALTTHLPGVTRVCTWQFSGDIAGIKKISPLDRRRVYQRLREIDMGELVAGANQLETLTLRNASIARLVDVSFLEQLTSLDLSHADIDRSFSDFKCLTKLTRLKSLNLERTGLSDLGFLKSLPLLETLQMAGAAVSSLEGLKNAPTLITLDISNVWLENEVVPLSGFKSLQHLRSDLLGAMNPLDIRLDAPALQTASFRFCWLQHRNFLSKCPRLQELDLRDTILFEGGAPSVLPHLSKLCLSSNPAAIRSIDWEHGKKLQSLQLTKWDPAFADAEGFDGSFLGSIPQLTALKIAKLSKYTQLPSNPPQVTTLSLHQVKASNAEALKRLVSTNHKLQTLHLVADRAVTLSLPPFANPSLLCDLKLINVTVDNLDTLRSAANLRSLEISGFGTILNAASLAILRHCPRLTTLKICQNTAFDDLAPVAMLPHLEVLSVRHTSVNSVSALATLTTLRELELGYTHVADVTPLRPLAHLHRVGLPANADCAVFHDANAFPMLRAVVHEHVDGARDCLLAGHDAIAPW